MRQEDGSGSVFDAMISGEANGHETVDARSSGWVSERTECHYQNAATCPDCGVGMVRQGACLTCPACGYGGCC